MCLCLNPETAPETESKSSTNSSSNSAGNFNRGETSLKQNIIRTRKSRNSRKIETMISNMNINIVRYRAVLQDPKPGYFLPKFLDEFRMLPSSLYTPFATEKFASFILSWGTHLVTAVKLGGKFKMTRTVKDSAWNDYKWLELLYGANTTK